MNRSKPSERLILRWWTVGPALLLLLLGAGVLLLSPRTSEMPLVTIYMAQDCVECRRWASHLGRRGFRTVMGSPTEHESVRRQLRLPPGFGGPLIAKVDGMYVSGFVPAREVHLLVGRRLGDAVIGVAVRGKPAGAPGVNTVIPKPYTVFAILPGGMMRPIRNYNDPLH